MGGFRVGQHLDSVEVHLDGLDPTRLHPATARAIATQMLAAADKAMDYIDQLSRQQVLEALHPNGTPLVVFVEAAALLSDSGENPEYDRALVDLVQYTAGLTDDHKANIADLLSKRAGRQTFPSST